MRAPASATTLLVMGNLHDLLLLIGMGTAVVVWLKLTRARELAVLEVRRQCQRHGLQLLDETVGLRALRVRRSVAGRVIERGYGFDVSIDGDDRQPGRLWMRAGQLSAITLPTTGSSRDDAKAAEVSEMIARLGREGAPAERVPSASPPSGNVIPFRPRRQDRPRQGPDQSAG